MVKPFRASGQRGNVKFWRTMRGRFGSSRNESAAIATAPAAADPKRNWRLVVGMIGKRNYLAGFAGMCRRSSRITRTAHLRAQRTDLFRRLFGFGKNSVANRLAL